MAENARDCLASMRQITLVHGLHNVISLMSTSHSGGALERELRDVRQRIVFMMDLAEGMLWTAVLALVTRDVELARSVAGTRAELTRGQRELDTMCVDLLTAHGRSTRELPLRALKMSVDIERTAEVAVGVSEIASELAGQAPLYNYDDLLTLAGMVHGMMHDVRAAFAEGDPGRAENVIERKHDVALLYGQVFAGLLDRMRHDVSNVQRGSQLQRTASALTRVAEHTAGLAEAVLEIAHGRPGRVSSLPPLKTSSSTSE
jgi:phosphate transport system protein